MPLDELLKIANQRAMPSLVAPARLFNRHLRLSLGAAFAICVLCAVLYQEGFVSGSISKTLDSHSCIVETTRVLCRHGLLGYAPPASANIQVTSKDTAARIQLQVGKIYEAVGRLEDAEKAYLKALDSDVEATRRAAVDSLRRVVFRRRGSIWARATEALVAPLRTGAAGAMSTLTTIVLSLVGAIAIFWLLTPLGKRQGRGKLEIVPFADSTEGRQATNFLEILALTLARMHVHFRQRGVALAPPGARARLPVVIGGNATQLAELAAGIAPEGWARGFGRVLRRPEYSIRGSLQLDGTNFNIIMRLEQAGQTLRIWDNLFAPPTLFQAQKDLAYEVLIFLKRRMNP